MSFVTGQGFDAHRFGEDRPLVLGGVELPSDQGLQGHSDADVLSHAICDAILGAIAAGDIGTHFPDSDQQYKNISSLKLLERVVAMAETRRCRIVHVDATIIAQNPKIDPYRQAIRESLLTVLGSAGLNIKATTTENMGFTGRGEGIAAMAVATVETP